MLVCVTLLRSQVILGELEKLLPVERFDRMSPGAVVVAHVGPDDRFANGWRGFGLEPFPPAPMHATLSVSLGGDEPGPPSTCRGTIVNVVKDAVVAMNLRRVIPGRQFVFWLFISNFIC